MQFTKKMCNFAAVYVFMKNNVIPKYLNEKQNVISFVVGTAIFAELFILIFQPFNSPNWHLRADYNMDPAMQDWIYLGFATLAVLTAMGIIAISRTLMYKYAKKHEISYWGFAAWIAAELCSMSVVYTLFVWFISHSVEPFSVFERAMGYTACILLIPYAIFLLYFSMKDKTLQLQQIQLAWRDKLSTLRDVPQEENKALFNFKDEKGELKLSLRTQSLFFIEAADNYVVIHYLNSGKMQKFMLRSTLKRIESEFEEQDLIRCHRSYIVNFKNVKVLRKTEEGLILDFDHDKVPNIPVSKTYSQHLLERFTNEAE